MTKGMKQDSRVLGIVLFILVAAALRLIPHPPNFSPIMSMALFGGAYLGRRSFAMLIPLAAMLISDLFLGFHEMMPAVYISVALFALVGFASSSWLKEKAPLRLAGMSVVGSLLFFVVTNAAVWLQSGMYEKSMTGLVTCFVAAIPFYWNAVAGDLFYTAVLFGGFVLAEKALPQLREA